MPLISPTGGLKIDATVSTSVAEIFLSDNRFLEENMYDGMAVIDVPQADGITNYETAADFQGFGESECDGEAMGKTEMTRVPYKCKTASYRGSRDTCQIEDTVHATNGAEALLTPLQQDLSYQVSKGIWYTMWFGNYNSSDQRLKHQDGYFTKLVATTGVSDTTAYKYATTLSTGSALTSAVALDVLRDLSRNCKEALLALPTNMKVFHMTKEFHDVLKDAMNANNATERYAEKEINGIMVPSWDGIRIVVHEQWTKGIWKDYWGNTYARAYGVILCASNALWHVRVSNNKYPFLKFRTVDQDFGFQTRAATKIKFCLRLPKPQYIAWAN